MYLADLKRWHWLLIGALVGCAVAFAIPEPGSDRDSTWRVPITCEDLIAAASQSTPANPALRNVVIHPPREGATLVTGEFMYRKHLHAFMLSVPSPVTLSDGTRFANARELIDQIPFNNGQIPYTFCWWEQRWVRLLICSGAGVIVIGGIWPFVINLLVGAGLGKKSPPPPEYDLDRFKPEQEKRS